ncbi:MAG: hypothetical protein K2X68_04035 [Novosphingobium sp.]|nr:hypothetical protein [Novosphingobium sp.]
MGKMMMVLVVVMMGCYAGAKAHTSVDSLQSTRVSTIDARIARELR